MKKLKLIWKNMKQCGPSMKILTQVSYLVDLPTEKTRPLLFTMIGVEDEQEKKQLSVKNTYMHKFLHYISHLYVKEFSFCLAY